MLIMQCIRSNVQVKVNLTEFNLNDYIADSFLSESKEELNTIIEDRAIQFYFQPIIVAKMELFMHMNH